MENDSEKTGNISAIFDQTVEEIIDETSLRQRLGSGKKLKVKYGVDPTSPDLHLGHAIALRKLRQFQDLGHETVLLIGDFTTKIGDPSDRTSTRPILTDEEIRANMQTYVEQARLIINPKKTKIQFNSEWLAKKTYADIIQVAMNVSVSSLLDREDFANRLKNKQPLAFHELFYPFTQALDSVEMKADVELGGWDQRLNILMGRELQKKVDQQPQDIVITKPLLGLDGERKMSKSLGNYIGLTESPDQMFGKVMSIPDKLIESYALLAAVMNKEEVKKLITLHPRDAKAEVAYRITELYHGSDAAEQARVHFDETFKEKRVSVHLAAELRFNDSEVRLIDAVKQAAEVSRSQAERLIAQGAVKVDGEAVTDVELSVRLHPPKILQVGKHTFRKLVSHQ